MIEKEGQRVKIEKRVPLCEGEGKYENISLPESFFGLFLFSEKELPSGFQKRASS